VLLAGCASSRNSPPPPTNQYQPPLAPGQWSVLFSSQLVPAQIPLNGTLNFPGDGQGVHYLVTPMTVGLGQTVALAFTIGGTGHMVDLSQPAGTPSVRLFLWRAGDNLTAVGPYQQYRYWSVADAPDYGMATYSLSAKIDPALWTDVSAAPGSQFPSNFSACVADSYGIGFTLGGYFAGHGQDVTGGTAWLTVDSFAVF
jgi:hypothetical protein